MNLCLKCGNYNSCPFAHPYIESCGDYRKKTNYDLLHSMNETQLATWLAAMLGAHPFDGTGNDYRKWLDWLRQEVSDAKD